MYEASVLHAGVLMQLLGRVAEVAMQELSSKLCPGNGRYTLKYPLWRVLQYVIKNAPY